MTSGTKTRLSPKEPCFKLVETWDDLFALYKQRNGVFFARPIGKLEKRLEALTGKVDTSVSELCSALFGFSLLRVEDIHAIQEHARGTPLSQGGVGRKLHGTLICIESLKKCLEPHLSEVVRPKFGVDDLDFEGNKERRKRAKELKKKFAEALDAFVTRPELLPPVREGAATVSFQRWGLPVQAPLPWALIQLAMAFVGKLKKLPTKAELRERALEAYPSLASRAKSNEKMSLVRRKKSEEAFWAKIFRRAGLSGLPESIPWAMQKGKGL